VKITVQITPGELADRGLWSRACDVLGMQRVTVEMNTAQPILLTGDQAMRIGLIAIEAAREDSR
jgi:hypothetical protein